MRTLLLLVTTAALLLAGCGTRTGTTATDTGAAPATGAPTDIPAAPGRVATRGAVTVLQDGRPEVCLGAVAESWPPQCSGPPLLGWSWGRGADGVDEPGGSVVSGGADAYEQAGSVRWGQYLLTGTWDGRALAVDTSVPATLHTTLPEVPVERTPGTRDVPSDRVARELLERVPGALASYVVGDRVLVEVVYDDGSLQDWVDATYDEPVDLRPALVDVAAD